MLSKHSRDSAWHAWEGAMVIGFQRQRHAWPPRLGAARRLGFLQSSAMGAEHGKDGWGGGEEGPEAAGRRCLLLTPRGAGCLVSAANQTSDRSPRSRSTMRVGYDSRCVYRVRRSGSVDQWIGGSQIRGVDRRPFPILNRPGVLQPRPSSVRASPRIHASTHPRILAARVTM